MKKRWIWAAALLLSAALFLDASAETPGFGYVNSTDVALRMEPGGSRITRLPIDTSVWIVDSRTDESGVLWHHIRAGAAEGAVRRAREGWMMAEFIDAGDDIWHDILAVSADDSGMIALRSDGTAEAVGKPVVAKDGSGWMSPGTWTKDSRGIRQVAAMGNNGYCTLDQRGIFSSTEASNGAFEGQRLVLIDGQSDALFGITEDYRLINRAGWSFPREAWMTPETLSGVVKMQGNDSFLLLLTKDARLLSLRVFTDPEDHNPPDFSAWAQVRDFDLAWIYSGDYPRHMPRRAYAAVGLNGAVMAHPAEVSALVSGWKDIREVEIGNHWVMGLHADGTAVSAALPGYEAPDVSGWTEIQSIEAGPEYAVGVRRDGTLIFAGDFFFSMGS